MANRPEPEIAITPDLVRRLLNDQFPELASQEIRELSRGWDNTNFRLGNDQLVRVPHRAVAAQLVVSEQRWLPRLGGQLDIAVPAPTHSGVPTDFYPWPWSVTSYFEGTEAARAELRAPAETAKTLGNFFAQLHVAAPDDAPQNPYRGTPLIDRRSSFLANVDLLDDRYDKQHLIAAFDRACAVEPSTKAVWLHGDLHGRNMVVHDGELSAVIDWGDICTGDRATDLAGAFMLVPEHIHIVQQHSGSTDADWERARGWALNFAVIYLAHCDDDEVMLSLGIGLLTALFGAT